MRKVGMALSDGVEWHLGAIAECVMHELRCVFRLQVCDRGKGMCRLRGIETD